MQMRMSRSKLDEIKNGLCFNDSILPDGYDKVIETVDKMDAHGIMLKWFKTPSGGYIHHCVGGPSAISGGRLLFEFNGFTFRRTIDYCYVCGFDEATTLIWVIKHGDYLPDTVDNWVKS